VTHGDADGLSGNLLPSEEDQTDAWMHHDSPVTSVTAVLALLACLGAEAIAAVAGQPELAALRRMETRRQLRAMPLTPHLVMFGRIQQLSRTCGPAVRLSSRPPSLRTELSTNQTLLFREMTCCASICLQAFTSLCRSHISGQVRYERPLWILGTTG
jgi:hypothetical protein